MHVLFSYISVLNMDNKDTFKNQQCNRCTWGIQHKLICSICSIQVKTKQHIGATDLR